MTATLLLGPILAPDIFVHLLYLLAISFSSPNTFAEGTDLRNCLNLTLVHDIMECFHLFHCCDCIRLLGRSFCGILEYTNSIRQIQGTCEACKMAEKCIGIGLNDQDIQGLHKSGS